MYPGTGTMYTKGCSLRRWLDKSQYTENPHERTTTFKNLYPMVIRILIQRYKILTLTGTAKKNWELSSKRKRLFLNAYQAGKSF